MFDATIIEQFANRLYSKARNVIGKYTVLGAVIFAALSSFIGHLLQRSGDAGISTQLLLGIGALIGGALGYSVGQEKAFKFKLEAQEALCLLQIEKNTRPVK